MLKVKKSVNKSESKESKPKLVKMTKGEKKADVHPKEVENYEKGGWSK